MVTHATKSSVTTGGLYDHIKGVPVVSKLAKPLSPKIRAYLEECVALCCPDNVYVCDGSEDENTQLLKLLEKKGTIRALPKYENW